MAKRNGLEHRLRLLSLLSEFDPDFRMSAVNSQLGRIMSCLEIMRNVLRGSKDREEMVKLSTYDFEKMLSALFSSVVTSFAYINVKGKDIDEVLKRTRMNAFFEEFLNPAQTENKDSGG